jgi:hypothetical protein
MHAEVSFSHKIQNASAFTVDQLSNTGNAFTLKILPMLCLEIPCDRLTLCQLIALLYSNLSTNQLL